MKFDTAAHWEEKELRKPEKALKPNATTFPGPERPVPTCGPWHPRMRGGRGTPGSQTFEKHYTLHVSLFKELLMACKETVCNPDFPGIFARTESVCFLQKQTLVLQNKQKTY